MNLRTKLCFTNHFILFCSTQNCFAHKLTLAADSDSAEFSRATVDGNKQSGVVVTDSWGVVIDEAAAVVIDSVGVNAATEVGVIPVLIAMTVKSN